MSETLLEMSTSLKDLYSQLDQQNDFGSEACSKFVWDALADINTKDKLKRSVTRLVRKEEVMCVFFFMLLKSRRHNMEIISPSNFTYPEDKRTKQSCGKKVPDIPTVYVIFVFHERDRIITKLFAGSGLIPDAAKRYLTVF